MIISPDDLRKICNYTEINKTVNLDFFMFYTFDFDTCTSDDAMKEYKRQNIVNNRNLLIDAILNDDFDNYNNNKDSIPIEIFEDSSKLITITNKLPCKTIQLDNEHLPYLNNYIYDDILNTLDSLTIQNGESISKLDNNFYEKLKHKIIYFDNKISVESKRGSATSIICGTEAYDCITINQNYNMFENHHKDIFLGLNLIRSERIQKDKIIIIRTTDQLENGLNVANCCNGTYYMKETENWENFIKWFEIK